MGCRYAEEWAFADGGLRQIDGLLRFFGAESPVMPV
jgi:hypothetical protein